MCISNKFQWLLLGWGLHFKTHRWMFKRSLLCGCDMMTLFFLDLRSDFNPFKIFQKYELYIFEEVSCYMGLHG